MMCAIQRGWDRRREKMRGLPMQLDASMWFLVVAIVVSGLVAGYMHFTKEAKITRARLEMDGLRTAILEYEAYMETELTTNDLHLLFEDFTDSNGDPHKAILQEKGNWTASGCNDPWGHPYSIVGTQESGDRKLQSQGPSTSETISLSL